jgi:hypothetical protein
MNGHKYKRRAIQSSSNRNHNHACAELPGCRGLAFGFNSSSLRSYSLCRKRRPVLAASRPPRLRYHNLMVAEHARE